MTGVGATASLMICRPCFEFQSYVQRIEQNGIYVSDLPPYAEESDVYNFFRQYGHIADFYLADNGSYCLINFSNNEPLGHILNYPVFMHDRRLRIRKRHQNSRQGETENELPLYHKELLNLLSKKESFKQQVEEFFSFLAANENDFVNRHQVCTDLELALKGVSSSYKIQPFGSSVNGLAFKDSDLDVFYGKEPHTNGPDISNVFNKVSKILMKHSKFISVKPIPNARVPIIKLVHKATGCNCDLSFKNTMGVQNSELIKFLTTLDERIKPLFMIVKFWAKLHHVTGKRMSNYALIMLLINFLQSLNEPILPPLCKLKHDGAVRIKVAEWVVSFDYDDTKLRPISNVLPVEELLIRFFQSIVRTDFENYVISPLEGALIHKGYFHDMNLSAELRDYVSNVNAGSQPLKIDSVLSIQDPIELNLNLTKNVSKHDFQCFKDHCNVAIDISYKEPPHLFLSKLLSNVYPHPNNSARKSWHLNPLHVPLKPLRPYMTLSVPIPKDVEDKILWRNELVKKLKLILKKVLKIDVEHTVNKESKPAADQSLLCKGSQVLWRDRDKLWNRWYRKKQDIVVCDKDNDEEVQVVFMKDEGDQNAQGSSSRKRKQDEEAPDTKRRKFVEKLSQKQETKELVEEDIIVLESAESDRETSADSFNDETPTNTVVERCLTDEVNLTNDMVRRKHALPASLPILHFSCNVCLDINSVRIEVSDVKSLNNYFNSLCSFLQNFIVQHIT